MSRKPNIVSPRMTRKCERRSPTVPRISVPVPVAPVRAPVSLLRIREVVEKLLLLPRGVPGKAHVIRRLLDVAFLHRHPDGVYFLAGRRDCDGRRQGRSRCRYTFICLRCRSNRTGGSVSVRILGVAVSYVFCFGRWVEVEERLLVAGLGRHSGRGGYRGRVQWLGGPRCGVGGGWEGCCGGFWDQGCGRRFCVSVVKFVWKKYRFRFWGVSILTVEADKILR